MFLNFPSRVLTAFISGTIFILLPIAAPLSGLCQQLNSSRANHTPWRSLLDGNVAAQWTGFGKQVFPEKGWRVANGVLKHDKNGGGGDIVTRDLFSDFELEWEWGIGSDGNSGIKYFITDERSGAIGHEYQMLDDCAQVKKGKPGKGNTGSFYDVLPPVNPPLKPAGETNYSRILVQGSHVEHWLNGSKILEYELDSPEVKNAISNSKFKNVAGFGSKIRGRILLQDHGGEVWFRNIRIRELPSQR